MGRGGARRPSRKDFVLLREDAAAGDIFDPEVKRDGARMHLATQLRQRAEVSLNQCGRETIRPIINAAKVHDQDNAVVLHRERNAVCVSFLSYR